MAKKAVTKTGPTGGRRDLRYKDAATAPEIVSEKRLTFFVPEKTYRQLRRLAGAFYAANAEVADGEERLPESPSAMLREALNYYLDGIQAKDRSRTPKQWDARFEALRDGGKKA